MACAPSGRVDRRPIAALNMTADQRLAQLKLNLGRIPELMHADRGALRARQRPAFQLEAVEPIQSRSSAIASSSAAPSARRRR